GVWTAWLIAVWLAPMLIDGGRLYQLWLTQVRIYGHQNFYILSSWPNWVAASLLVLVWWKTAQSRDPLYMAFGATALIIPLGGAYSAVGLLFPVLAGGSCNMLALSVSFIGLLDLPIISRLFAYQMLPSLIALLVGMLLQYVIRKRTLAQG
ncbi:MAG: hypothetical protein HGA19_07840, partial [Oscillochloris sp.]|nr:hypothetical protein [Oscillochloris sp.]